MAVHDRLCVTASFLTGLTIIKSLTALHLPYCQFWIQHSVACQMPCTSEHAHVAIPPVSQVYLINTRKLGLTPQHCPQYNFFRVVSYLINIYCILLISNCQRCLQVITRIRPPSQMETDAGMMHDKLHKQVATI